VPTSAAMHAQLQPDWCAHRNSWNVPMQHFELL